jgi:hypothetical protein
LLTAACSDGTTPAGSIFLKSYRHPSGLVLEAPAMLAAEQTARGFIFSPANSTNLRSPTRIVAELRSGPSPQGDWPERRRIKDRTVNYRVDVDTDAGSGGDSHRLRGWEQRGNDYLWIEQEIQVEVPLEPDFSTVWQIVESIGTESK